MGGKVQVFHARREVGGRDRGGVHRGQGVGLDSARSSPYKVDATYLRLFLCVGVNEAGGSVETDVEN